MIDNLVIGAQCPLWGFADVRDTARFFDLATSYAGPTDMLWDNSKALPTVVAAFVIVLYSIGLYEKVTGRQISASQVACSLSRK